MEIKELKLVKKQWLHAKSRVEVDWKCPRLRYWSYEYGGRGVTKNTTSKELYIGTTIHDALATIATLTQAGVSVDIDQLARAAGAQLRASLLPEDWSVTTPDEDEYAQEQSCMVEGMVRGFYKHVWPRLIQQYPVITFVEKEMEFPHDRDGKFDPEGEFVFIAKPDLILSNDQGEAVYFEYKTTSSKNEKWVNSWDTAIQLHSVIRAVKATTGLDITSVVVQGLFKGFESYGKQSSVFCYAYKKAGHPPFSEEQISYEYRSGFKRTPVWELDGGIREWVEEMPDHVLADQFPQTPPIFINDDLIDQFFKQRAVREAQIREFRQHIDPIDRIDEVFPQRFDQCQPAWGFACSYRKLCHSGVDPFEEGYVWREPHLQHPDRFENI